MNLPGAIRPCMNLKLLRDPAEMSCMFVDELFVTSGPGLRFYKVFGIKV